jgi:hypothetical protein
MWIRFTVAIISAALLRAQQDPTALLDRLRIKIADSLDRMPRYMCTETVDRSMFAPDVQRPGSACDEGHSRRSTHLASSDRLRLDVAMASAVEMYSWAGESRFSDRDLLDIVHEGAISTGSFAAFLTGIFRTEDASFTYQGETAEAGRTVAQFGFRVPYEKSHYTYGNGQYRMLTGYDGTFLVDTKSGDLVRLDVRTSRLAPETAACYAFTTLDYGRVRIKDSDFLLPTVAHLRILKTDGGEAENRTTFSGCHEFLGESTITFDAPRGVAVDARGGQVSQAASIPPGLPFRVALAQGIETESAAAGDSIKAKLITPIKDRSKVWFPAGATITARIMRIRHYYGSASALALDLKLETVDVAGVPVRLTARPDMGRGFQKAKKGTMQQRVGLGTLSGFEDRATSFVFGGVRTHYLVATGLESKWITANPETGDAASVTNSGNAPP